MSKLAQVAAFVSLLLLSIMQSVEIKGTKFYYAVYALITCEIN
jgi:hypothetical protein